MHAHDIGQWRHQHLFSGADPGHGERRTLQVIALTATMMVAEVGGGMMFGSMALLADGWHMASHSAALGITVFAYRFARRHLQDPRFTFGTGKVGVLGGFTSAVALAFIALLMVWESAGRLFEPRAISFDEAMVVAALGLVVNLLSAWLLRETPHDHGHGHDHHHEHGHHHGHDHNLRAAYIHVLADALTSVLAIVALLAGKYFGWVWMDPLMGIVGAGVIGIWCYGLLRDTGRILVDADTGEDEATEIRRAVEADKDNLVADLHVWRVGPRHLAAIVSVVTHFPRPPGHYKALLVGRADLVHLAVEVHQGPGEPCLPA